MKPNSAKFDLAQLLNKAGAPKFATGGLWDSSLLQVAAGGQKPYYTQGEKDWIAAREKELEEYNQRVADYNAKLGAYQKEAEAYNAAVAPYLSDVEAYNKALEDYKANVYEPYMSNVEAYNKAREEYTTNIYDPYVKQIEDYNKALSEYQTNVYNPYLSQVEEYNKAVADYETNVYNPYLKRVEEYNQTLTGEAPADPTPFDRVAPVTPKAFEVAKPIEPKAFEMVQPVTPEAFSRTVPVAPDVTAPVKPGEPAAMQYTPQQFEEYVTAARNRAQKSAGQRANALSIAAAPEQYNLSGFGLSLPFAKGGPVSTDQFIRRANGSPEEGEKKEDLGMLENLDKKITKEERDEYFRKLEAELLQMQTQGISGRLIRGPRGVDVRASTQIDGVRPFVDIDPARLALERIGASYGQMGPEGGYDVTLSKQMPITLPGGMVSAPTTLSGVYQRPIGKTGSLAVQGSYTVDQQRPNYQAGLMYKQRFADGGEASTDDFIQQTMTGTGPRIMAQAAQEPGVIRAKDLEGPATRSEQSLQAYLRSSIPDLKIVENPVLSKIGRRAEVDMEIPHIIWIDPKQRDKTREATLLHEAEHSRVGKSMLGVPEKDQYDNDIRFDNLYGDTGFARLKMVQNFIKNKDKIEKFFGVPVFDVYFEKAVYENQRHPSALFEEQIATLSALEQLTNKSITKGMPELFPDDKAAAIYDAITGLRQTRLDAKDLPPFTPQYKSGLDWIKGKLRMRADGSPEWGEIAGQMTMGTPMTEQEQEQPSLSRQALNAIIGAGKQVGANLKEAVTDPVAFNKRALGNIASQLQDNPQEFIMNWTGGGLGGIIRPKGGGNLLSGQVERAIDPLLPKVSGRRPSEVLEEMKRTYPPESLFRLSEETGRLVEDSFQSLERSTALENWIKDKFGNYIKKQMGTEDDPVRKLADEMSEKVQADYQAGLKRIAKMKEDIAKAKARGKNTDVSERELADEIDRVEEAFQNASILPIQLGPYTHVTSILGEAREKAGMSPFPIAKSSQGRSYEELADTPFVPLTKKEIDSRIKTAETMGRGWAPDAPNFTENPWLSKLGEEDLVYRIRAEDLNEKQIFTHTIDELRNALNPNSGLPQNLLLKPEDMQGLGIEKAFRHVNKINDWRAQQRIAANLEEAKRSAETIKEYPDTPKKLKWQQLKPMEYTELPPGYSINSTYEGPALFGPDGKKITNLGEDPKFDSDPRFSPLQKALNFLSKNDLEKALQYEGSTMRHCVGGYCDDVWTGQTNIFSLRDRKGEPHVTIETAPSDIRRDGNTPKDFIFQNPEVGVRLGVWPKNESRWPEDVDTFLDDVQNSRKVIATPEFQQWLRNKPAEILQIKGKNNGKPAEQYMPYIQDFIRSQQWSRIGDLENTGFVPINMKMLDSLRNKGVEINFTFLDQGSQPYVTKQEFNRLADLVGGVNKYTD